MPSLHDIQAGFYRDLLDPDSNWTLSHLAAGGRIDPAESLAIYRHNFFSNYQAQLAEAYPVIRRLVGDDYFALAARAHVRDTPSACGDINAYGGSFGAFLARFPGAQALAYLPDVARLEWSIHRAFTAADVPVLNIIRLATVTAAQHTHLRFTLHPSATLLASNWPILAIWRVNQPGFSGEPCVDLSAGGVRLLVARRKGEIVLETLSDAEHALLDALARDQHLGEATEAGLAVDPNFNLGDCLSAQLAHETLIDFQLD